MPFTVFQKGRRPNQRTQALGEVDFEKDEQVVDFVMGRWADRDQHRNAIERQWYINVAQYLGFQYHRFDDLNGKVVLPRAPSWRVRLVVNRLMSNVRKTVSKAMRQRPKWVSIPATEEVEDMAVSIIANKILTYYWRFLDMDRKLIDAFYWSSVTGNVFWSVVWDPEKGPEFALNDKDIERLPSQFKTRELRSMLSTLRLGDLDINVHSPFEIDPDPEALRIDDVTHLIHTKSHTLTYIRERYKAGKNVNADTSDENALTQFYQRRIQSLVGPSIQSVDSKNQSEEQHSVLMHSLWVNPSKRYPRGVYAVVADSKVLHKRLELPNPFHRVPFAHMIEIPVPGRFWGTCALEHSIPLQAEYNRGRSQLIENRNLMSRPKWLLPRGSGVIRTALTSEPGEVVEYNFGLKPEAWNPPAPPDYTRQLLDFALRDLEDISAVHEVTNARAPSGVRSGVAIAQLQEQDDQMLAPTFQIAENEIGKLGGWALQLVAHNMKENRVMKIVGETRDVESFVFTGGDLFGENRSRPGVNYFDVELQLGSQLPVSRQARQQFVLDLVNFGILDREEDRKKIFEMLELGTQEGVIDDDRLDRQAARRENLAIMHDEDTEVNDWDNHELHLEEHERFQKQPEYLKATSPAQRKRMDEHKADHLERTQPPPAATPPGPQTLGGPLPGAPPSAAGGLPALPADFIPPAPQQFPIAPQVEEPPLSVEDLLQALQGNEGGGF